MGVDVGASWCYRSVRCVHIHYVWSVVRDRPAQRHLIVSVAQLLIQTAHRGTPRVHGAVQIVHHGISRIRRPVMADAVLHLRHRCQRSVVGNGIVPVRDIARQMWLEMPRIEVGIVLMLLESLRTEVQAAQLRRTGRTNTGDKVS